MGTEMLVLNQNHIELPPTIYMKYKGKSLTVREEKGRIVIEEKQPESKYSALRGCLAKSKLSSVAFSDAKEIEKELEK